MEQGNLDRRAALQLLLAIGGAGLMSDVHSGAHFASRRESQRVPPTGPVRQIYDEIEAVLQLTADIWNSQEFHRLKEVWDADDPEPWYVPEEIEEPFFNWAQIERYWNPGRKVLRAFRWQFSKLKVKPLAPDLCLAIFDHFYEISLAVGPPSPPTAGFDRCLALFRKKPEGWRHVLYAQCPLGPDTYVRALRQRIVSPDFAGFEESLQGDQ